MLPVLATPSSAQNFDEIFRKVNASVVVRTRGRDVGPGGIVNFKQVGSGVLISSDGRVMTSAHVVNGMDEITVEGVGGQVIRATVPPGGQFTMRVLRRGKILELTGTSQ